MLLTDSVLYIPDSCHGLIVVGPILSKAVDAFSSRSDNKNDGLFPPPKLITGVL